MSDPRRDPDPVAFSVVDEDDNVVYEYRPTPVQRTFHECGVVNCILEGSRGTGKSVAIRNDAHLRAMAVPGLSYLVLRRTMPELRMSHLKFIDREMAALGGRFNKTESIAYYPNGSMGFFSHCETEEDMMRLLSSEFVVIYFDEITTFTQDMIVKIGTCARVPEGSGLTALIRGGTNPVGCGAEYVYTHYITKDVDLEANPDYRPEHYVAIHTTLEDNRHIDKTEYAKQFATMDPHLRRAWLDGEWLIQGAYFTDFAPTLKGEPWHVIDRLPYVYDGTSMKFLLDAPWVRIYRAIDWGFKPDPAVCLWIAILPNGRGIAFKERTWRSTTAEQVAKDIREDSEGMKITGTYCDPTMFAGSEATDHSIGDIFERNGVPLTKGVNDRKALGEAIHEHFNILLDDEQPKLQIFRPDKSHGCPMLVKTLPTIKSDKTDLRKMADGNDHWVMALGYYCMSLVGSSKAPNVVTPKPWMKPKFGTRRRPVMGAESVRANG